jgi:3'(2'), 5'-bisphosphate nucleotidase
MPSSTTTPYAKELHIALLAVARASQLTRAVYLSTAKGTHTKSDHSPVTIGDFGAQALIISALKHNFPADEIAAEEEADDLRQDASLRDAVWGYVKDTVSEHDKELGGKIDTAERMMDVIDMGRSPGGSKGRVWTIDPIDGTKGFLRGGQYAIALALLVDGDVTVGVLGCPNLPVDDSVRIDPNIGHDQSGSGADIGVVVSAEKGCGAYSQPIANVSGSGKKIFMRELDGLQDATFCESVEAAHSNHSQQGRIAAALGITKPSVRMDSQAKYVSVARGAGDIYLRLPAKAGYEEKIWDHAAGDLIVREAGGIVTDIYGKPLNFGVGRTLKENKGFVVTEKRIHQQVLEAVQKVMRDDGKL